MAAPGPPPTYTVMAEAGLALVAERRTAPAARLLAKACTLPAGDPLRKVAESQAPPASALWRDGEEWAWGTRDWRTFAPRPSPSSCRIPRGSRHPRSPSASASVPLSYLQLVTPGRGTRPRSTWRHCQVPQCATWVWTDGSATDGVLNGGAGSLIVWPDGEELPIRTPAGRLCSSFRAEMIAPPPSCALLPAREPPYAEDPVICNHRQSALAALQNGPADQYGPPTGPCRAARLRRYDGGKQQQKQNNKNIHRGKWRDISRHSI